MVEEREGKGIGAWKRDERKTFLDLIQAENKVRLLEVGAGTGVYGKYFQDCGIQVVATDLSGAMVKCCQEKGLEAYEMDFLNLNFPSETFDAVFAMNCLLHAPDENLPSILSIIHQVLRVDGLFYWGQYGGVEQAGVYEDDHYRPKRFYSFLTDNRMKEMAQEYFSIHAFKTIELEEEEDFHFQSLILRKS
jgi:SAM-dependent methyltransferase